jgi:hypothetical protein
MKKLNEIIRKLTVKAQLMKKDYADILKDKNGSFFTEHALGIVITVAIAGLALTIFFGMFKNQLAPELSRKITEFFNFAG